MFVCLLLSVLDVVEPLGAIIMLIEDPVRHIRGRLELEDAHRGLKYTVTHEANKWVVGVCTVWVGGGSDGTHETESKVKAFCR